MGCKAIRKERTRKVALEGQGAPDTAQRGILLGVNEGGTTQSAASFGARRSAFFYSFRHKGDMRMNFQAGMIPGICALAVGALLTFFSDKLCHREKNVPQMKLLGVALAVVGALMVFTV